MPVKNDQAISGQTDIYGLIAHPAKHSLSPRLHNGGFRYHHLDAIYLAFDSQATGAQVCQSIRTLNLKGCNLSLPYKETVLPYLDEITPPAQLISAVNTVKRQGSRLIGTNTDGLGLVRALQKTLNIQKSRILLLGGGATARAIIVALRAAAPLSLMVLQRSNSNHYGQLQQLVRDLHWPQLTCQSWDTLDQLNWSQFDLVVNATSLGFGRQAGASPVSARVLQQLKLSAQLWDVIYQPAPTLFLQQGQRLGLKTTNGLPMLYQQANAAFKFWTGKTLPSADPIFD